MGFCKALLVQELKPTVIKASVILKYDQSTNQSLNSFCRLYHTEKASDAISQIASKAGIYIFLGHRTVTNFEL